jgi:hypothetical protein
MPQRRQGRKERAPTSDEKPTVHYFPTLVRRPAGAQPTIFRRLDRKCKNLDKAVIFVMEELEKHQRLNATIVVGAREIYIDEIAQRYEALKKACGTD